MHTVFPEGVIEQTIIPALVSRAESPEGLPIVEFPANTALGEVLRRFCDYGPPEEEGGTVDERVRRYVAEFISFDKDEFLHDKTFRELDCLAGELLSRVNAGYLELAEVRGIVERLVKEFGIRYLKLLKSDPLTASTVDNNSGDTLKPAYMCWQNLYYRYPEPTIIGNLHGYLKEEGDFPRVESIDRARLSLLSQLVSDIGISPIDLTVDTKNALTKSILDHALPAVAAFEKVQPTQVNSTTICEIIDDIFDTRMFMDNFRRCNREAWSGGWLMKVCCRTLAMLPLWTITTNTIEDIIKKHDLPTDILSQIVTNLKWFRLFVSWMEYTTVFARRAEYVDTILYPNGTLDEDNFNAFIRQGGSLELLLQYEKLYLNGTVSASPRGITTDAITGKLELLKRKSTDESSDIEVKVRTRVYNYRRDAFATTMLSYLIPNEQLGNTPTSEVDRQMEYFVGIGNSMLRENIERPVDELFYYALFELDKWRKSFAKVLYRALGIEYANTVKNTTEISAPMLAEISASVVINLMIEATTQLEISDLGK